jgi:hypothetical protein
MVDTVRTKAALLALLADNTTGDITPQVLRDVLVTVMGCYGGVHIESGSTAQVLVSTVAEKMTEWAHNGISSEVTPDYINNEITIDEAGDYQVDFTTSFTGINNAVFDFILYVDGVTTGHGCSTTSPAAAVIQGASFSNQLTIAAGEALSIWVTSSLSGSMTVKFSDLNLKRIG